MPESARRGIPYDLDLGAGHWLAWTRVLGEASHAYYGLPYDPDGTRVGAVFYHLRSDGGYCACALWFYRAVDPRASEAERTRGVWTWDGDADVPTITASVLCVCGTCHGYITDGRWNSLGCQHPAA